jgi:dsRNA-specific ribonuclease
LRLTAIINNTAAMSEQACPKIREDRILAKQKLIEEKFSPMRGDHFKSFIISLLKRTKIVQTDIDKFVEKIKIFEQAFTHKSFNPLCNYEVLEFQGDTIVNYCTVEYLSKRFPELTADDGHGVSTLARLKINMVSKAVFSKCAESMGFAEHIASNMYVRKENMKSLLEDTLEAFHGALHKVQTLCDPQSKRPGYLVGVGASYRFMAGYFNTLEISTKYNDLYDPKTRLKQLLESVYKGYPKFSTDQHLDPNGKIVFTTKITIPDIKPYKIWGTGVGFEKAISEQNSCESAIQQLNADGYVDHRTVDHRTVDHRTVDHRM